VHGHVTVVIVRRKPRGVDVDAHASKGRSILILQEYGAGAELSAIWSVGGVANQGIRYLALSENGQAEISEGPAYFPSGHIARDVDDGSIQVREIVNHDLTPLAKQLGDAVSQGYQRT
jgi:hypothetical protein